MAYTEETTRSIVSLAEAFEFLKLPVGDDPTEQIIYAWIDRVSGIVEEITGRKIKAQAVTEICHGSGSDYQPMRFFPVVRLQSENEPTVTTPHVTAIQYRDSDGTGTFANLLTDITKAYVSPVEAEAWKIDLLGGDIFPQGRFNVQVKYYAGWIYPPEEIKNLTLEMLSSMWDESKQGKGVLLNTSTSFSGSPGAAGDSYRDLRPRWLGVLNRYRIWSV